MGLNPGDTATKDSMITGAAFRDFYQNHWPEEFYVDDITYTFENDTGDFVMPDDTEVRLDDLGQACCHKPLDGIKRDTAFPMHWLWNRIMAKQEKALLVAFHVAPEKVDELVAAAKHVGARLI